MIKAIPKVNLRDKATWLEENTIAVSAVELPKYGKRLFAEEYFRRRDIILLAIIPDDFSQSYLTLLETWTRRNNSLIPPNIRFTSCDCACYTDMPELCEEELEYLREDNRELFERYRIRIGILKGYNAQSYERIRKSLCATVDYYLLYLTGEIRSNPRWFSLPKFFEENFPGDLDKPVYLHGCSLKHLEDIQKLDIKVEGVITGSHIATAIYKGNPHYRRETRIFQAWQKYKEKAASL